MALPESLIEQLRTGTVTKGVFKLDCYLICKAKYVKRKAFSLKANGGVCFSSIAILFAIISEERFLTSLTLLSKAEKDNNRKNVYPFFSNEQGSGYVNL